MWLELRTIFDRLSTDPSARAVVFSGAGPKAFTAGLDLQAATATGSGSGSGSGPDDVLISDSTASEDVARRATALRRHILDLQDCVSSVERCEKRTSETFIFLSDRTSTCMIVKDSTGFFGGWDQHIKIAVICILHGYSLGLGIDLCTSADIRLCTKDVRLSVKEVDIGLAADVGSLSRLPRCVNSSSWVKDVCLTARPFDASEAYRVGLVSAIYDDKSRAFSAAVDLARLIASKSPVAVQGTKEILNSCRDRPLSDGT